MLYDTVTNLLALQWAKNSISNRRDIPVGKWRPLKTS